MADVKETLKRIRLTQTKEVQEFVRAAADCDFEIDMLYDRAVVDAKSILGVLSLGLSKVVTVRYWGVNGRFEDVLAKYAAA